MLTQALVDTHGQLRDCHIDSIVTVRVGGDSAGDHPATQLNALARIQVDGQGAEHAAGALLLDDGAIRRRRAEERLHDGVVRPLDGRLDTNHVAAERLRQARPAAPQGGPRPLFVVERADSEEGPALQH